MHRSAVWTEDQGRAASATAARLSGPHVRLAGTQDFAEHRVRATRLARLQHACWAVTSPSVPDTLNVKHTFPGRRGHSPGKLWAASMQVRFSYKQQ